MLSTVKPFIRKLTPQHIKKMGPDKTAAAAVSSSSAPSSVGDDHKKCNDMLYNAVTKNKRVQFLIDSIESLGCKIPQDFFICR